MIKRIFEHIMDYFEVISIKNGTLFGRKLFDSEERTYKYFKYEGDIIDSKFNGKGYLEWSFPVDESEDEKNIWYAWKYEGDFYDGEFHGRGIKASQTGVKEIYNGEFLNGKYHGSGILEWEEDDEGEWTECRYEGDFLNGKYHGKGVLFYEDIFTYTGEFLNGKYHGKGTMKYDESTMLEGLFKNGRFWDGLCTFPTMEEIKKDYSIGELNNIMYASRIWKLDLDQCGYGYEYEEYFSINLNNDLLTCPSGISYKFKFLFKNCDSGVMFKGIKFRQLKS